MLKCKPSATLLLALALCLGLTAGCGSESSRRPLSGNVTYQGKPVEGMITFFAKDRPVCGALIRAGRFVVPAEQGLEPGNYKVAISWPVPGGVLTPEEVAAGASPRARESLPAKYNEKTELTAEVKASGATELKYDLD